MKPLEKKQFLKDLETMIFYFDTKQVEENKGLLLELFLTGQIESRIVSRYGMRQAEIMKRFDISRLA